MSKKVIIDTDPGLDDAVAILYALNCGKFDVLGLTTVAGNIGLEKTTRNAGGLLAAMGCRDIPVVAGAAKAMLRENIDAIVIHGDDGLRGVTLPSAIERAQDNAAAWLASQLMAHDAGEVDVFALGPLTNIAQLINEYPDAAERIGHLIIMGGTIDEPGNAGPGSEFNFASDPEATAIVLRSKIHATVIPLDVTRRVRADVQFFQSLRGSTAGDIAADMISAYMVDGKTSRPLHDPCVMLYDVAPEHFGVELFHLSVDLSDGADAGALKKRDNGAAVAVAMRVDVPAVLQVLKDGLS
jgi:purine nucleosidase